MFTGTYSRAYYMPLTPALLHNVQLRKHLVLQIKLEK